MVPQDSETAVFWVKNPTVNPASLRVSVHDLVVSSPALASSMVLTTWDEGTGITSDSELDTLALCDVIVPVQTLTGGAVIRVELTLTMLDVTGSIAQDELGALNFVAAMRDAAAGPFPSSACDDDGVIISSNLPSQMAHTGSDLPSEWLTLAGALLGVGVLLLVGRRKREKKALPE
jgi:LPXTG-motif cell wall-anchored protein